MLDSASILPSVGQAFLNLGINSKRIADRNYGVGELIFITVIVDSQAQHAEVVTGVTERDAFDQFCK